METIINKIIPFNKELNIVVAHTFGYQGIGKDGKIPWYIPEDMTHFKHITTPKENDTTTFSIVVMGRKTWDSIPDKFKPLSNRYNVILSNDETYRLEQNTIYNCGKLLKTEENISKRTGVFFTTWDNFMNTDYIKIESELNKEYSKLEPTLTLTSNSGNSVEYSVENPQEKDARIKAQKEAKAEAKTKKKIKGGKLYYSSLSRTRRRI